MEIKIDTVNKDVAYLQILDDAGKITDTISIAHADDRAFNAKLDAKIAEIGARTKQAASATEKVAILVDAANAKIAAKALEPQPAEEEAIP